jgi:hypothetical protein
MNLEMFEGAPPQQAMLHVRFNSNQRRRFKRPATPSTTRGKARDGSKLKIQQSARSRYHGNRQSLSRTSFTLYVELDEPARR